MNTYALTAREFDFERLALHDVGRRHLDGEGREVALHARRDAEAARRRVHARAVLHVLHFLQSKRARCFSAVQNERGSKGTRAWINFQAYEQVAAQTAVSMPRTFRKILLFSNQPR